MHHKGALAGEDGDSPGQYEVIPRIEQSIVDPGSTVVINLLVTGYGRIDNSKIVFYPPISIIDSLASKFISGFKFTPEAHMIQWGGHTQNINGAGFTQPLSGMTSTKWPGKTQFFDVHNSSSDPVPQIATETALGPNDEHPLRIELKVAKYARPGTYTAYAVLTYFNGASWRTSNVPINFTIRTVFQRYELGVSILGVLAALGSGTGMIPYIVKFCLWVSKLFS